MRSFDLYHLDVDENARWSAVEALMDRIESGVEGRPAFEILDPGNGSMIVEVVLAAMGDTAAWIVKRSKKTLNFFLARGNGSEYYECIYWGCPEYVRDCCLLSRADAEFGILVLLRRETLNGDWQWLPQEQVFAR